MAMHLGKAWDEVTGIVFELDSVDVRSTTVVVLCSAQDVESGRLQNHHIVLVCTTRT